jgi:hypothetical protein
MAHIVEVIGPRCRRFWELEVAGWLTFPRRFP